MADSTIEDDKTIFESHIKNIAIPNDVKVAYILCPGMGNNTINVYYTHHGNHYELFNYGAEDSVMGYCSDVICLIRDILSLRKNEITGKNPLNAIEAKIGRLKRLVTRIKLLLISPDQYARVVLLGLSHGALLMYGAILRLLCDVELNRSHYEKLRIFTVGAPIYPPSTLLLPYEKDQSINLLNILNNYNRRKPPPKNSTACVIAAAHKAMQLGLPLLGIDADEATKEQHAEYAASLGKQPLRDYLAGIEEELDGDTQASLEAWRAAASDVLAGSKRVPDDALTAIKDAVVRDCAGPGRGRGEHPAGESAPLMSMIGGGEAARKREVEMWRNLATLVQGTCMGRPCRTVLVVAGRDNVDSMVNSLLRDRGVGGNVPPDAGWPPRGTIQRLP